MGGSFDLAQLLMRLAAYARHQPWCGHLRGGCDCGFDELLQEMRELGTEAGIRALKEGAASQQVLWSKR